MIATRTLGVLFFVAIALVGAALAFNIKGARDRYLHYIEKGNRVSSMYVQERVKRYHNFMDAMIQFIGAVFLVVSTLLVIAEIRDIVGR